MAGFMTVVAGLSSWAFFSRMLWLATKIVGLNISSCEFPGKLSDGFVCCESVMDLFFNIVAGKYFVGLLC